MTELTVGTWNCRMGLDRKLEAVSRLRCDVLVVPECSSHPALARQPGVAFTWKGRYPRKGLGVFAFGGWRLEPAADPTPLPWVLPVHLVDPAGNAAGLLLALWTVANSTERWGTYSTQVAATIDAWESALASGPTILAGDTNCSARGPSGERHRSNMRRLEDIGVRSAHHTHQGVEHGAETEMTLRWFGRGGAPSFFHCDYVFLSHDLLPRLVSAEIGTMADWVESGLSDHTPVVARIAGASG